MFEDDSNKLDWQDLSRIFMGMAPRDIEKIYGFSNSSFWISLEFLNNTTEYVARDVDFMNQGITAIDAQIFRNGVMSSLTDKRVLGKTPAYRVRLSPGEVVQVVARIKYVSIIATKWELHEHSTSEYRNEAFSNFLNGGFAGIFLALLIYSIVLFLTIRDRNFLLFFLFNTSAGLSLLGLTGFYGMLGLSDSLSYLTPVLANIMVATGLLFARSTLKMKSFSLLLDHLAASLAALAVLSAGLLLLGGFNQILYLSSVVMPLGLLICIIAAVFAHLRGIHITVHYFTSWICVFVFSTFWLLAVMQIAPMNAFNVGYADIGVGIQLLLLSFGLVGNMRKVRDEYRLLLIEHQEKLEPTVKESSSVID